MKRPKQETQWVSGFGLVVSMPAVMPAGISGLLGYAYLVVAGSQPNGSLARGSVTMRAVRRARPSMVMRSVAVEGM